MTTKQKNSNPLKDSKLDLLDDIQENSYFRWVIDNRKFLPYGFAALVLLIALSFKFTSSKTVAAESNYLLAENYFAELKHSFSKEAKSDNTTTDLKNLITITKDYPELESRYDGNIAQMLILLDRGKEASPFAERSLKRVSKDQLPEFLIFSEITLHIAEADYTQALEKSKSLKEQMLQNNKASFNNHLFAFNLLRIAMLEEKTGSDTGESEAWKEWKKYANGTDNQKLASAASTINNLLKEGEFSLNEYISIQESKKNNLREGVQ